MTGEAASVEATITSNGQEVEFVAGGESSSTANNAAVESSSSAVVERPPLEVADELTERGTKAEKEGDFGEAADCYSRALELSLTISNGQEVVAGESSSAANNAAVESSSSVLVVEERLPLEVADELMERGAKVEKEGDFAEAADCFSRALELRLGGEGGCEDASVEATIASNGQKVVAGESWSTANNAAVAVEEKPSLEVVEELSERGAKAEKEGDFAEAADCYSRALELRVAYYGEIDPECVQSYYKYGCVLLQKAQEEADPFGAMPKKDDESHIVADNKKNGSVTNGLSGQSSVTSAFSHTAPEEASNEKDQEDGEESDDEELAEGDEDESDLDLAWKMLDLARAISEKNPGDTMEKVNILSALAEVALEREDMETSLSDYLNALAILERLVEPDSRLIAELNFRICLCLEVGSKAEEAIPYCERAISICKSRVQRLNNEVKSSTGSTTSAASAVDQTIELSSSGSISNDDVLEKEKEIGTLTELSSDLEKKLEDLRQLVANPPSLLSDILAMVSANMARAGDSTVPPVMNSSQLGVASNSGDVDSPTVSTAHTNSASAPVTHLGVVGRGVKRVVMSTVGSEPAPTKKIQLDTTPAKDDDKDS